MKNHEPERRKFLRIPVTARVKFKEGGREEILFTEDLGEGGLFIKMEKPPFVGTQLDLEISFPNEATLVKAKGEIVWRYEGKGCGIRFLRITQAAREALRNYIDTAEAKEEKPA